MDRMGLFIFRLLLQEKLITKKESSIYLLGINLLIKYFFSIMILLLFSVINQSLKEVVIFCLFFVPLRSYAGGLHLKNEIYCIVVSIAILPLILFSSNQLELNRTIYMIIATLSYFTVLLIGPVDNKNKPFDKKEITFFTKKLKKICLVQYGMTLAFYFFGFDKIVRLNSWSIVLNLLSLVLGKYYRRRKHRFIL